MQTRRTFTMSVFGLFACFTCLLLFAEVAWEPVFPETQNPEIGKLLTNAVAIVKRANTDVQSFVVENASEKKLEDDPFLKSWVISDTVGEGTNAITRIVRFASENGPIVHASKRVASEINRHPDNYDIGYYTNGCVMTFKTRGQPNIFMQFNKSGTLRSFFHSEASTKITASLSCNADGALTSEIYKKDSK